MAEEAAGEAPKKKGKKALLIPVVVLVLGLAGGGYFFMSSKKAEANALAPSTTTTTEAGKIIRLQPVTLNLSDGRVLKVGVALQFVAEPHDHDIAAIVAPAGGGHGAAEAPTSISPSPLNGAEAKAINETILFLGNMTFDELSKPGARAHVKEELAEKITEAYHGDVIQVYFTDFVMS